MGPNNIMYNTYNIVYLYPSAFLTVTKRAHDLCFRGNTVEPVRVLRSIGILYPNHSVVDDLTTWRTGNVHD